MTQIYSPRKVLLSNLRQVNPHQFLGGDKSRENRNRMTGIVQQVSSSWKCRAFFPSVDT